MTAATISTALVEMEKVFRDAWAGKPCDYPNTKFQVSSVDDADTWARWRVQHNTRDQATLAGATGARRYRARGNVIITIFTPANAGIKSAYNAAEPVIEAYQNASTASGIWFRNVRVVEDADAEASNWYPLVVIADFEYEQFN